MSKTYLSGITGAGKAHYLFKRISEELSSKEQSSLSKGGVPSPDLRAFLFVKDEELSSFYDDLKAFFGSEQRHSIFKKPEILMFPSDDAQQRAFTADKIKHLNNFILCASDLSFEASVAAPDSDSGIIFKQGQKHKFDDLVHSFVGLGYTRMNFVEDRLQFAVRGDIIDIWPAANDSPVRVLFEYDIIEALRTFDAGSQLSNAFINEIKILPVNPQNDTAAIKDYFERQSEYKKIDYRVRTPSFLVMMDMICHCERMRSNPIPEAKSFRKLLIVNLNQKMDPRLLLSGMTHRKLCCSSIIHWKKLPKPSLKSTIC